MPNSSIANPSLSIPVFSFHFPFEFKLSLLCPFQSSFAALLLNYDHGVLYSLDNLGALHHQSKAQDSFAFPCFSSHEVSDLRNLLRMYAEWHSQLLPYFPFDQFIHKVEDAGSRRVKSCIAELKERVACGGDPTKLTESFPDNETQQNEQDVNMEERTPQQDDDLFKDDSVNEMHEDVLDELFNQTIEETSHSMQGTTSGAEMPPSDETTENSGLTADRADRNTSSAEVTDEQRALMEAKRQKALERAAARSRLLKSS